jgi:hypothetical protein
MSLQKERQSFGALHLSLGHKQFNKLNYETIVVKISSTSESDHQQSTFGLTIAGYCPCYIESVQENSTAFKAGLRRSDLIMKINNTNCCRATLKTTLNLIKSSSPLLLTVYRLSGNTHLKRSSCHQSQVQKEKNNKQNILSKLSNWWKFQSCSSTGTSSSKNNQKDTSFYCDSIAMKTAATQSTLNCGDTGYESLSRQCSSDLQTNQTNEDDFTIETVTNTTNSYSDYDLTIDHHEKQKNTKQTINIEEKLNESKTRLIGNLIKMEDNFVSYLNNAVSTLVRPLRGFFMKQQDYFCLFQNIEKILVISENFLRSMDKWSAFDLYTRIGQLYTQKVIYFII